MCLQYAYVETVNHQPHKWTQDLNLKQNFGFELGVLLESSHVFYLTGAEDIMTHVKKYWPCVNKYLFCAPIKSQQCFIKPSK